MTRLFKQESEAILMRFSLVARIDTDSPDLMEPFIRQLVPKGSIDKVGERGFVVRVNMEGSSAKDLNRSMLSALRKVEKKTRLRTEWTAEDGTILRFFDYVLKKRIPP